MATYETSTSHPFSPRGAMKDVVLIEKVIEVTTAMIDNANDDVGLFYVPKGFTVIGGFMRADDLDTDGSPTVAFDVGDAADEDRLFAASQVGRTGTGSIALAATGAGYTYTADTEIRLYCQTAATAGAAGTVHIGIYGRYAMDFTGATGETPV